MNWGLYFEETNIPQLLNVGRFGESLRRAMDEQVLLDGISRGGGLVNEMRCQGLQDHRDGGLCYDSPVCVL